MSEELATCGKVYEESLLTTYFSSTYLDGVFKLYNNFVPEYDGVVTLYVQLNKFYFVSTSDRSSISADTYLINMAEIVEQVNGYLKAGASGTTVAKAKSWLKLFWWLAKQPATTTTRLEEVGGFSSIRSGIGENVTNITNFPINAYGNMSAVYNAFGDNKLFVSSAAHKQSNTPTGESYFFDIAVKKGMPVFFITVLTGLSNTAWVERLLSRTLTVYGEVVDLNAKNN